MSGLKTTRRRQFVVKEKPLYRSIQTGSQTIRWLLVEKRFFNSLNRLAIFGNNKSLLVDHHQLNHQLELLNSQKSR